MSNITLNDDGNLPDSFKFPARGDVSFETSAMQAKVDIRTDASDSVELTINGQWFTAADLKDLRKVLKALAKHLKATA